MLTLLAILDIYLFIYLFIQFINQQWHRSTSNDIEIQTYCDFTLNFMFIYCEVMLLLFFAITNIMLKSLTSYFIEGEGGTGA